MISHGLWQRRFGGAARCHRRARSRSSTRPHEIIGVMPPELRWPERAELWKPLALPQGAREARSSFWLPVIGRLKPGVSVEQAQTEMAGISARIAEQFPSNRGYGANVVGLREQLVGSVERPLAILMASVGLRPADRVREPRQPDAGPDRGAPARAGRADRARRRSRATDPTDRHRGAGAGDDRRRGRRRCSRTGRPASSSRSPATAFRAPQQIALDARVLGFAFAIATLAALLAGLLPAAAGVARRRRRRAARRRTAGRTRRQPADPQRARRRRGRARAGAADRCRACCSRRSGACSASTAASASIGSAWRRSACRAAPIGRRTTCAGLLRAACSIASAPCPASNPPRSRPACCSRCSRTRAS